MQVNERCIIDWLAFNLSINRSKLIEMKVNWTRLIVVSIAYAISIAVFFWSLSLLEERGEKVKEQQEKEHFDQRFKLLDDDCN